MTILDKLKKYFEENSKEQIEADWQEMKNFDNVDSPTVEQFLLYNVNDCICEEMDKQGVDSYHCPYHNTTWH